MSISEQVKELREFGCFGTVKQAMLEAADTIEALCAKLEDMERSKERNKKMLRYGFCPDCGAPVGRNASSCFECGAVLDWDLIKDMERPADDCGGWIECESGKLPDKEVICCDVCGEIIIGYIHETYESEQTGFSAENSHEYMYNCVKWMEKPKP